MKNSVKSTSFERNKDRDDRVIITLKKKIPASGYGPKDIIKLLLKELKVG